MNKFSQTKYYLCVIVCGYFVLIFAQNHFIRFIVDLDRVFRHSGFEGTSFPNLLLQTTTNVFLQRGGAWRPYSCSVNNPLTQFLKFIFPIYAQCSNLNVHFQLRCATNYKDIPLHSKHIDTKAVRNLDFDLKFQNC